MPRDEAIAFPRIIGVRADDSAGIINALRYNRSCIWAVWNDKLGIIRSVKNESIDSCIVVQIIIASQLVFIVNPKGRDIIGPKRTCERSVSAAIQSDALVTA